MKKRLRADNVEQLLDIVQAVRQDEDPEAFLAKREAEREAARRAEEERLREERRQSRKKEKEETAEKSGKAASKETENRKKAKEETAKNPGKAAPKETENRKKEKEERTKNSGKAVWEEPESGKATQAEPLRETQTEPVAKKRGEAAEKPRREMRDGDPDKSPDAPPEEPDEFEQFLDEESDTEDDIAGVLSEGLNRFGTFLKQKLAGGKKPGKAGGRHRKEAFSAKQQEEELWKDDMSDSAVGETEASDPLQTAGKGEAVKQPKRRSASGGISENAQAVGRRILQSLHMEPEEEEPKADETEQKGRQPEAGETEQKERQPAAGGANQRKAEKAEKKGRQPEPGKEEELVGPIFLSSGGEEEPDQSRESDPEKKDSADRRKKDRGRSIKDRLSAHKEPHLVSFGRPGERFHDVLVQLADKGIGRRELAMLGAGMVLAVLVIALVVNGISGMLVQRRKQKHVSADEGLYVAVESEPQQWCSSGEVQLTIRAQSGSVTGIRINGETVQADAEGLVVTEAADYLLMAEITTDSGTLEAQIEIPMIDAQAPAVTASRDGGQITLTASDGRSGVKEIRYAVMEENDFQELPLYRKYTEPLTYEEGMIYFYYAEDQAGNRSTPVVTTLETAQSILTQETGLTLFPGETVSVQAQAQPSGALLNNLTYESSNTEVATVDRYGQVTAQGEGSAQIRISADGVSDISCLVDVTSQRTVTVSAIGDCTLGTDENFNTATSFDAYYAMYGSSYFFQNVREILENDDVTFANFEGTLTTQTTRENKQYAFKGAPEYTAVLTDGSVEVVTLANNHSSDYGTQSLTDTQQYLEEAGIDYCSGDTIVLREVNGITTAYIGIYVLAEGMAKETQVRETIAEAQAQGAQLIVMAFHWGNEKETTPDATQRSLAHTAIDCGADLVVGHHPHVLQGIEKYNGKYIVYSLGNFCFGGNSAPSDTDTMIFRQTFTVSQDGAAADDAVEIIPCSITSSAGYNDYCPRPVTGTEAENIMARINEYSAEFGDTIYTASSGLE